MALVTAAVVTVAVAAVGVLAVRSAEAELTEEVDNDLLERAGLIDRSEWRNDDRFRGLRAQGLGFFDMGDSLGARLRQDPFGFLVSFDMHAQVVLTLDEMIDTGRASVGEVVLTLDDEVRVLPDSETLQRARQTGQVIETVVGEAGEPLRVMTVAVSDGMYFQLARPLDEVERAVDDLTGRVAVFGALAVAAAASASWLLAGRALRPIADLAEAAEHIAATDDIERPVDSSGSGEVGRLARSFATMLGALAASRRQQQRLVADASHELRTPLTSLRANVELLRRGDEMSPSDTAEVLDDLETELTELSDLTAELVELASDVRNDEESDLVDLTGIAESAAERARRRTGRDVAVIALRRVAVEGRPEALARAVRNLVDNALKFSENGGVEVVVDGGAVTVHDTGPGIPESERERVFERFHRAESSRGRPGSGLGLAIVRQVAEIHGGTVSAGPSRLGGAAVGFRVPEIDD